MSGFNDPYSFFRWEYLCSLIWPDAYDLIIILYM